MEQSGFNVTIKYTTTESPNGAKTTDFEGEARILVAAVVEVILSLVGSTGNVLTCLAVLRNSSLQFATNFFIVSLAIADLLVCTILVPMRAAQHFSFYNGKADILPMAVQVAGFLGRVNIVASICNLGALSIDRCIAIKYPMRYRFGIRFATRRVLGIIVTFWIFAVVFTSLPYVPGISDDVFLVGFIVFVLLVTFIIIVAYLRIFHVANVSRKRRQNRKVGTVEIGFDEKPGKRKVDKSSLNVHFTVGCRDFAEIPSIANPSSVTVREIQPQNNKSSLQHSGGRRVSEVIPIPKPSNLSVREIQPRLMKSSSLHSEGRRHSAVLPMSNQGAFHAWNRQAVSPSSTSDLQETSELPLVDLHSRKRQAVGSSSTSELPKTSELPPTTSSVDVHTRNRQAVGPSSTSDLQETSELPPTTSPVDLHSRSRQAVGSSSTSDLRKTSELSPTISSVDLHSRNRQAVGSSSTSDLRKTSELPPTTSAVADLHSRNTSKSANDASPPCKSGAVKNVHSSMIDSIDQSRMKKERHRDNKTTKTIGIVIGAFIALVYPRIIMILYHYSNPATPASKLAKFWVRILLYSNSAINPMVYAWRMRDFRNEFTKMILSLFRCGKTSNQLMSHQAHGTTGQSSTNISTDVALT